MATAAALALSERPLALLYMDENVAGGVSDSSENDKAGANRGIAS